MTDGASAGLEVPGYHLRGCIARGAVTSVHRAEAVGHPGRLLVVKHLRTRPDPASVARVRQVAAVLARLDHPNVLPLLDVVDTVSGLALVMPLAPGGSLAEAIARAPAGLAPAMVAHIGTRIADGLTAIHEQGLIHGAITARSVLFDARGRPLLADTGAVLLHGGADHGHAPAADRAQRAPAHAAADDLRALGSVLAAALAGTTEHALSVEADEAAPPTDEAAPGGHEPGRWTRVVLIAAAGLVLLVPLVLAVTAIADTEAVVASPPPTSANPSNSSVQVDPPAPARRTEPTPPPRDAPGPDADAPVPRRPPPRCSGLDVPAGDGTVLLADLDGRGCSTPVRWNGRQLVAAAAEAGPRRWELLADAGDQLLFGDLSCDDRDAPVLYRPATGELFVFDGLVAPGEEITVTGRPSGGIGGRATVVTDSAGCDRIEVDQRR
ncbi:MAG: protein kinase [Nitriliruptoraceae bacterium]